MAGPGGQQKFAGLKMRPQYIYKNIAMGLVLKRLTPSAPGHAMCGPVGLEPLTLGVERASKCHKPEVSRSFS